MLQLVSEWKKYLHPKYQQTLIFFPDFGRKQKKKTKMLGQITNYGKIMEV